MSERLTPWRVGQKVSTRKLNVLQGIVEKVMRATGYDVDTSPFALDFPELEWFIGVVTDEGPEGAADYSDSRYWVRDVTIVRAANSDEAIEIEDAPDWDPGDGLGDVEPIYTVTNLPEWLDETHSLPEGTPVIFFRSHDGAELGEEESGPPKRPNRRYVMSVGGPDREGQYEGEVDQMVAQHVKGYALTPIITDLSL